MEVFDWLIRVGSWTVPAACVVSMVAGYLAGRADGALRARLELLRAVRKGVR